MKTRSYPLHPVRRRPEFKGQWESPTWEKAPVLEISHFRPESSDHRPLTRAKLLYSIEGLYGIFRVQDRYVRCIHRRYQDPVFNDSCVEFFVQPVSDKGYFNFEFNCGGALRASYIEDPVRTGSGFRSFKRLTKQDGRQVLIYHSLPPRIDPEWDEETTWYLEFYIPHQLMEKYIGSVNINPGTVWRCNLFKCADQTSHPHWAAWSAVDDLNFHLPHCFGKIEFMAAEPVGQPLS
jgi:hypothetical protein